MEPLSILIGAALGSAGLSGVLAGVVQLSRAARKARFIEHLKKSLDGGEQTGPGVTVLKTALDRERLNLAALSLIDMPAVYFYFLGIASLSSGVWISLILLAYSQGLFPELAEVPQWPWVLVAAAVLGILWVAMSIDRRIQSRRQRFIRTALAPGADLDAIARATLSAPAPLPVTVHGAQAG